MMSRIALALVMMAASFVPNARAAGEKSLENLGRLSCQVIEMTTRNKRGQEMGTDLYLRCSVADYFIKFCESAVSREEVEPYLSDDIIGGGITVRLQLREGEWDSCGEADMVQSRIGPYAVIAEILN